MPEDFGNLSGYGPQQIYLNVSVVGQNDVENYTRYRIVVKYLAKSHGMWINDPSSWSAAAGAESYGGSFTIPAPGTADITLLDTTFVRYHNSAGNASGFSATASIDTPHSGIGDGSASLTVPAPPRIPVVPEAPTIIGIDQVTSSSFRLRFSGNDNGGSSILEWEADVDESGSGFPSPVRKNNLTGTDVITGSPNTPGDQVWVRVRGRNAKGEGPWSTTVSTTLKAAPPSAPTSVVVEGVAPDTVTLTWGAPASNGGKAITGYDTRISSSPTMSPNAFHGDVTSPDEFTGRTPGVVYWGQVRAKNVDEDGAWSTAQPVTIPAGGKVWTGSIWKSSLWKVWTGSIWKIALVKVWTGSIWKVSK